MNSSEAYELGMHEGMRRFRMGGPVFTLVSDPSLYDSFCRGVDKGEADARQGVWYHNDDGTRIEYRRPSYVIVDFINRNTGARGRVGWCYVDGRRTEYTFAPEGTPVIERHYNGDDRGNESPFGPCYGTYRRWGPEPRLDLSARKLEATDEGAS